MTDQEYRTERKRILDERCARCGKQAEGFASIGDKRYCHGDQDGLTCYMLASSEENP
jgi:hypothetical protein